MNVSFERLAVSGMLAGCLVLDSIQATGGVDSVRHSTAGTQCHTVNVVRSVPPSFPGAKKTQVGSLDVWFGDTTVCVDRDMVDSVTISKYGVNAPPEAHEPRQFFVVTLFLNGTGRGSMVDTFGNERVDLYGQSGGRIFHIGRIDSDSAFLTFQFDDELPEARSFAYLFADNIRDSGISATP